MPSVPGRDSDLGERLRSLRTTRGLSVRELARRAGCSASLVSQVERGITTPSAGVVYALANELGVSLDALFSAEEPKEQSPVLAGHPSAQTDSIERSLARLGHATDVEAPAQTPGRTSNGVSSWGRALGADGEGIVQRAADRSTIDLSTGIRWERLTPSHDQRVDFLEVVYEPHGRSSDNNQAVRHDGREYLLVLEGELDAIIGFETIRLHEGDSLSFDPTTPHQYINPTDAKSRSLSVIVHEVAE